MSSALLPLHLAIVQAQHDCMRKRCMIHMPGPEDSCAGVSFTRLLLVWSLQPSKLVCCGRAHFFPGSPASSKATPRSITSYHTCLVLPCLVSHLSCITPVLYHTRLVSPPPCITPALFHTCLVSHPSCITPVLAARGAINRVSEVAQHSTPTGLGTGGRGKAQHGRDEAPVCSRVSAHVCA